MRRNLRLFPAYLILTQLNFWMPVFFLYFSSLFSLQEVLLLEAVYYISVVLLEVPSGYFSDRVGRKWSLVAAAAAGAVSGIIFASTRSFPAFCLAQIFFAGFMAFNSGSDTSLLYDTLKAAGRESEMLPLEASAHAKSLFFAAFGSVLGGAAALWGFHLAYALSAGAFFLAAAVATAFTEPPKTGEAAEKTMLKQIGACRKRLGDSTLKWIFFFYVGRTVFEHIPYEFFQPYIGFALGAAYLPLILGGHLALTKLISAFFAKRAAIWVESWGTAPVLLLTHATTTALILLMALWVHPVIVVLLLLRNIPHGLGQPIMNAAVHPRIGSGLRATYFSLQSLVGRLAFAGALAALSWWTGPGVESSPPALARLMLVMGLLSAVWLLGLAAKQPKA